MDTTDIYCNNKQTKKETSREVTLKQHSILQQQSKNVEVPSQFFFCLPQHLNNGLPKCRWFLLPPGTQG